MKCIIIEDQPPAQRILKKYVEDLGTLELVKIFSEANQAMDYLKENQVDLVFLDIHLPKLSGIDFLKIARQAGVRASTVSYSLQAANDAIADLRSGRIQGAAVLVPCRRSNRSVRSTPTTLRKPSS